MWEKCFPQLLLLKSVPASRQYLLKVTQSVNFLAREGIPLRGDGNEIVFYAVAVSTWS